MARPTGRPIRDEVMDEARSLIQRRGVNGFSYGDLAAELGIKAPSIHHHFPRKDDLIAAVTAQYRQEFNDDRNRIPGGNAPQMLEAFASLFTETATGDRMCLCGAVSADWTGVGDETKKEVAGFFDDQVAWLSERIQSGITEGSFRDDLDVDRTARTILALLEGAVLLSRAGDDNRLASSVCVTQLSLMAA